MNSTKKIITLFACLMMVASPIVTSSMQTSQNGIGDVEGIIPTACQITIVYDGVSQQVSGFTTSTVDIPSSSKTGYTFLYWNLGGTPLYPGTYTHAALCTMANSATISLTSVWSKNTYTVSFYNGVNCVSTKTCVFDEQIGTLPTVSKAGYTFLGWSPSGSASDIISSSTHYTTPNDRTYYAVWEGSKYTVSLIDGGKCIDTIECIYNNTYGTLPTLTKDGYTFKGWSTDKSGNNIVNSNTKYLKTTDSCLYAVWEAKKFTISFIDNGTKVNSKSLSFGSPIGTMPELSEKGKTFLGWSVDGTTKGIVASDKVFSDYGNVNLYSVWKINEYTVSLINGDVCVGTIVCAYNSAYGTLPTLAKEGHDFKGWATDKAGDNIINSNTKYLKTTDSYLYAVWGIKQFTITFIDNGTEVESKNLLFGSPIGTMPELAEKGRTFLGWSLDGTIEGIVATDKVFSDYGNVNLYSVWKINEYTVSLINGDVCINVIVCTYNNDYGALPTLTKEGYDFKGWATDMGGDNIVNSNTKYLDACDSYLYAIWETKQFMISFIDNGTEAGSKNLMFGNPIGTMPELSEKGRTFLGWSLDGTIEGIVASDKVFSDYGNVNLYSVWKINEYTVTFMNNDSEMFSKTVAYGYEYGVLPTPSMAGHTFIGWSLDGTENNIIGPQSLLEIDSDIELYPVWETNTYTIHFIDGVSEIETKDIMFGQNVGAMPSIACDGKEFVGWSLDGSERKIVTSIDSYDWEDDTVLYAVCNDIKQPISDGSVTNDDLTESKSSDETTMVINPEESSGSLFDNPVTIVVLILVVMGTLGISYWVYRKGLI